MAVTAQEILEALSGVGSPEQLKEVIELIKELTDVLPGLSGSYRKMSQEGKDAAKALDDAAENTSKWASSVDGITDKMAKMLGVMDADTTFVGFAGHLAAAATGSENAAFSLAELGTKLKTTFSVANIAASIASKFATAMKGLALDTDKAMVSFNKSTGALDMYGSQMIDIQQDFQALGVGIDDVAQTYTGLVNNLGSFNRMSDSQQETIAKNTAVLQELGVSADVTAANYNTLMSAFTMTEDQASKVQREMFVLAQTIGMPPKEMANGFQQALPQLAAFGKKSTDVYKKLAVNAKAAGMQVDQLLRITEQFDTFEGAAQAVGKLNALLGGPYLSTTRMIQNTDPTERMRMLSSAINDAGKSFDQMEYYERKATAAAMGLADVSELALLMNNRFDLLEPQTKQSAADLEALAEQTAKFNEVGEVLSNMFMSLVANLYPVINTIKEVAGEAMAFIAMYPSFKLVLAGLALGFGFLAIAIGAVTGPVGITIVALTTLMTVFSLVYSYIGSINGILNETSNSVKLLKIMLLTAFAVPIILVGMLYANFMLLKAVFVAIMEAFEYFQPTIDALLQPFFDRMEPIINYLVSFISNIRESEAMMTALYWTAMVIAAPIIAVFAVIGLAIAQVMAYIYLLSYAFEFFWNFILPFQIVIWKAFILPLWAAYDAISGLYTLLIVGQSPSFVDALGMVSEAFGAFGKAISAPIRAVESLFGVMKDFISFLLSPEVMDVLGGIFETGVNLVAGAFGFDAGAEAEQIAQARMDIEKAVVEANKELKSAIDNLTLAVRENNEKPPDQTVVNIDASLIKFFDIQEKRLERKMSGRPVYASTGGK